MTIKLNQIMGLGMFEGHRTILNNTGFFRTLGGLTGKINFVMLDTSISQKEKRKRAKALLQMTVPYKEE